MKSHPALVYGRVFARAGYGSTRKRWAQVERTEECSVVNLNTLSLSFNMIHSALMVEESRE